jgi:hypothetical protein
LNTCPVSRGNILSSCPSKIMQWLTVTQVEREASLKNVFHNTLGNNRDQYYKIIVENKLDKF